MTDEPNQPQDPPEAGAEDSPTPLDRLGLLAMQTVSIDDGLDHLELYTTEGLLTLLWHGPADADQVVICLGGAMGGLLGPDAGLFHRLGRELLPLGIAVMRVGYRRPNDLNLCVHDALAAMELSARHGGERFLTMGHSFGGAVAIQAAAHLEARSVPGVVTLATQSAGCEPVGEMGDRNLLFFHGTNDQILPHQASEMVQMLAGGGELVLLDGADHMLSPAGDKLLERLVAHIPAVMAS